MKKYLKNLSKTSILHYVKLFVRAAFFITMGILYLLGEVKEFTDYLPLHIIIWVWYFAEMVVRLLIPTNIESMGCEKVFAKKYVPSKVEREPKNQSAKTTFTVAAVWIAFNSVFYALNLFGVVDKYFLFMVALGYGVCDIICILFFCPFQTWFMKNRCCTTCRIYNWDFIMLCTPLVLIPSVYSYTLLALAILILARWEITYKRHPERFSERTNEALRCANCTEKLCKHKVQLQHYIKKHKDILFEKLEPVESGIKETYEKVKGKTTETIEKTKGAIVKTKDFTKDTYEIVKDKTKETYGLVKDRTKEFLGIENKKSDEGAPTESDFESAYENQLTIDLESAVSDSTDTETVVFDTTLTEEEAPHKEEEKTV